MLQCPTDSCLYGINGQWTFPQDIQRLLRKKRWLSHESWGMAAIDLRCMHKKRVAEINSPSLAGGNDFFAYCCRCKV